MLINNSTHGQKNVEIDFFFESYILKKKMLQQQKHKNIYLRLLIKSKHEITLYIYKLKK